MKQLTDCPTQTVRLSDSLFFFINSNGMVTMEAFVPKNIMEFSVLHNRNRFVSLLCPHAFE